MIRENKVHKLKTLPSYFQALWVGDKNFEVRFNDRDFMERDEIVLQEWIPGSEDKVPSDGEYTGREIRGFITYMSNF